MVALRNRQWEFRVGLNTVELLKIVSSSLNIGPHVAMNIAERLYTAGLLSYPRTESSAYPKSFDFRAILKEHTRHPVWGEYAGALLSNGFSEPKVWPCLQSDPNFSVENFMLLCLEHVYASTLACSLSKNLQIIQLWSLFLGNIPFWALNEKIFLLCVEALTFFLLLNMSKEQF